MRTCQKCGEQLGDAIDACWKCGTKRDGTEDAGFVDTRDTEVPDPEIPTAVSDATVVSVSNEDVVEGRNGYLLGFAAAMTLYVVLVIPIAIFFLFTVGPLAAVIFLVLFLPALNLCGKLATVWALGSWLLAACLYHALPVVSLLIVAHTFVVLRAGWSDRRKQLAAVDHSRRRREKKRRGDHI